MGTRIIHMLSSTVFTSCHQKTSLSVILHSVTFSYTPEMNYNGLDKNPIVRHKIIKHYLSKLFSSVIVNYILEFLSNEGKGNMVSIFYRETMETTSFHRYFTFIGYQNVTRGTIKVYYPHCISPSITGIEKGGKIVIKDSEIHINYSHKLLLEKFGIKWTI